MHRGFRVKWSVLLTLCLILFAGCEGDDNSTTNNNYPPPDVEDPADTLTLAGSESCRECHQAIYESWEKSRHTKKVRRADLSVVVNDVDGNGTNDFVQGGASLTFDVGLSPPAAQTTWDSYPLATGVEYPKLGWDGSALLLRVGPITYDVTFVLGGTGKWKQRYMNTIGESEYISPVQYNEVTRQYVPYHIEHWYTWNDSNGNGKPDSGETLTGYLYESGDTPVTEGKVRNSWQRRCIGCHVTGVRDVSLSPHGEYGRSIETMLAADTGPRFQELPVGCEACHGPSARHVQLGGGVGTAMNPADLAADRGDEVCGSCHGRGSSKNSEGLGYPWAAGSLVDGAFQPGSVLDDFYNHTTSSSNYWADGAGQSKSHHQQWLDHRDTPHSRAGVTCWKCHDPHGSAIPGDLKMPATELCLSCHDGQGNISSDDLTAHTGHTTPAGQDCTACHLALTAKSAIPGDIRSHTYRVIYPVESETTPGLPNACGECHRDESTTELTSMLRSRFGGVRPVAFASTAPASIGTGITLNGSMSFNPLGGSITYEWIYKAGPPSFSVDQLIAPTAVEALFVPSNPGTYTFMLVVTNRDGVRSYPDEVDVTVDTPIAQNAVDLRQSSYIGADNCAFCHPETHSNWQTTRHPLKTRRPHEGPGVVFIDTDENGVNDWIQGGNPPSFDLQTSPLQANTAWYGLSYGSGILAPAIGYDSTTKTYKATIGFVTYDITWILGGTGKWKQRYMATIGEGEYILPMQYNEATNQWVTYHTEHWYTMSGSTLSDYLYGQGDTPVLLDKTRNSWQRRCTVCHATGAVDMTRDATTKEYGKSIETMLSATSGPSLSDTGVACEACHGPGSQHAQAPFVRGSIVNPTKLSALRSNEVCGSCHNRGSSVNSEGFGYPWGPDAVGGHYIPGDDLDDFYVPTTASNQFWPDPFGHAKSHHQQWLDMRWSAHYKEAGMTCADCHESHEEDYSGQLKFEANVLCTKCHTDVEWQGNAAQNHSRHAYGSTANSCTECHLPFTAKSAINYDVRAHSFELIWPVTSTETGMTGTAIPNSCMTSGCHSSAEGDLSAWSPDDPASNAEATATITRLWGDLRPYATARVMDGGAPRRSATFTGATTVTLNGSMSFDANGDKIISWAWSILSAPTGSTATLSSRLVADPTIDLSVAGTYEFSLVVRDGKQASDPETVTVVIE